MTCPATLPDRLFQYIAGAFWRVLLVVYLVILATSRAQNCSRVALSIRAATTVIGLLPTYAEIGGAIGADFCRFAQGLAIGGQWVARCCWLRKMRRPIRALRRLCPSRCADGRDSGEPCVLIGQRYCF